MMKNERLTEIDENSTTIGNVDLEFWICTGFTVPLSLGALYLALTQMIFFFKKGSFGMNSKPTWKTSSSNPTPSRGLNNNAAILNFMIAFGCTCAFLRAAIDFRLPYGRHNDFGCNLAIKYKSGNYILSLLSMYLVLWFRQRVFYQHPRLKHLSSKLIRFVSWAMCFVMIATMLATAVIFFGVGSYVGVIKGCTVRGPLTSSRWVMLIGCTSIFQIFLLVLFIYPLMKHKREVQRSFTCKKNDIIIQLIKRATVTSILSVVSDVGFGLLILFLRREIVTISTFVCDVNIVFNAICVVMSFPDWKLRLLPWRISSNGVPAVTENCTDGQSKVLPIDSIA